MMATVGQQLATPQTGWKRSNAISSGISYVGTWERFETTIGSYQFTDNVGMFSITANDTMKFNFTGKKLLLKAYGNNDTSGFVLILDGVNQGNIKTAFGTPSTVVVYEKVDLEDREHSVEIKVLPYTSVSGATRTRLLFDSIDIDQDRDIGLVRAVVGSRLTAPESGWKRYDDNISSIKYVGSFTNGAGTGAFNGYSNYTSTIGDKIVFDFEGTKLRIIGARYTNRSDLIEIYVDGKLHGTHSQLGSELAQVLQVEIVGLRKARHRIEMVNKSSGSTTTFMALDAIDIDSDGRLFHPDEVTIISELEIGKRIRCNYAVASNGGEGVFSGLGKETDGFIRTSTTVPAINKGDFYFIMADEFNNKNILIADRNIQSFVSWDQLNSYGRVFGIPVDMGRVEFNFIARLLTGSITSNDDYSEWYKYIVTSTLNNTISAGDNSVWNWNSSSAYSWTTTTVTASSSSRARKGLSAVNAFNAAASSTVTSNTGYRPLFEVETLPMNRSFINYKGSYKRFAAGTPQIPETHASTDSIPPMTSSTTPSGFASASGYFSTSEAWQAFSDKPSGSMVWISNARTGWICYRFNMPIVITKYTILPPSDNTSVLTRSPKDWILEGSNDTTNGSDGSWVTLDTVTGTTGWEMNKKKEFTFSNTNSYLSYRIRVTLNSGDSSYVSIWQIELMERILAVPAIPSMWNTISVTLPSEDSFINDGMDDLSVLDRKKEDFVQNMTVNGSIGSGKLFKGSINLKKYFEITNVNVK
ncbi:MAG: hypothetical protein ACE3K2_27340 [Paenibacillus sp.]|uniref:hypothetical protein n=1 Tax=Paenibacillus sp. TaxID=58172 RepID=UPI003B77660D